jgi:hypothetical protein
MEPSQKKHDTKLGKKALAGAAPQTVTKIASCKILSKAQIANLRH